MRSTVPARRRLLTLSAMRGNAAARCAESNTAARSDGWKLTDGWADHQQPRRCRATSTSAQAEEKAENHENHWDRRTVRQPRSLRGPRQAPRPAPPLQHAPPLPGNPASPAGRGETSASNSVSAVSLWSRAIGCERADSAHRPGARSASRRPWPVQRAETRVKARPTAARPSPCAVRTFSGSYRPIALGSKPSPPQSAIYRVKSSMKGSISLKSALLSSFTSALAYTQSGYASR